MKNKDISDLAVAMYKNEPCRICGATITQSDLSELVYAGYSKDSKARAAHGSCWKRYPALKQGEPRREWVHQ